MAEPLATEPSVSLIVGLGNPGPNYELTRHNIGFLAVDYVVGILGGRWEKVSQFQALIAKVTLDGKPIVFLKPQTYMNLSGTAVAAYARYYRLTTQNFAVVYDDVTFDLGQLKCDIRQSAGSHNGMRSITQHIGADFFRFRMGVGPKVPDAIQLADFVLSSFTKEQLAALPKIFEDFFQKLKLLLAYGPTKVMNTIHSSA